MALPHRPVDRRNRRDRFCGRDHVLGVSAIVADPRDLLDFAVNEVAAPAGIAHKAVSPVPADANALPRTPVRYIGAHRVDASCNFVPGNSRILKTRPVPVFHHRIAMTNPAGFDFDSNLAAAGFRNFSFNQFQISTRFADLDGFHS